MGIVLFDWETSHTTKRVVKPLFIKPYLFDGYLTESTSYPHFSLRAYLTKGDLRCFVKLSNAQFTSNFLFDGYLTEDIFVIVGELRKMWQLIGDKIEEIIYKLKEALAA